VRGALRDRGGSYDVIVVGLGAMGSSTAYQLAKRGARVLGLEQFTPAHELGSSGGLTRIIRLAYFEHPSYVPLLKAAWALWPDIERDADDHLLEVTGGLYIGRAGSDVLDGALLSARQHGLDHEIVDAQESRRRWPAMNVDDDMQTLHEPLAGLLFAQRCIAAHLRLAERHGAELHFDEAVTGWAVDAGGGVSVTTTAGTYSAARIVLAAGAWLPKVMPQVESRLGVPLMVERNVAFWFEPAERPEIFERDRLPVWIMELDPEYAYYGFPALPEQPARGAAAATPAQGAKAARHHDRRRVDPDTVDRVANDDDEATVRTFLRHYMPLADGKRLDARVCMYTNTPDENFVLGLDPADERVVIASPCSGHGFKFSNVVGVICADLALTGHTDFDIDFLSPARFARGA
jgi:sarcosine oxidase